MLKRKCFNFGRNDSPLLDWLELDFDTALGPSVIIGWGRESVSPDFVIDWGDGTIVTPGSGEWEGGPEITSRGFLSHEYNMPPRVYTARISASYARYRGGTQNLTALTAIRGSLPESWEPAYPDAYTVFNTFAYAKNLIDVGPGLLSKNRNAWSISGVFDSTGLPYVPEDLFSYSPLCLHCQNLFLNGSLTRIEGDVFSDAPQLMAAPYAFAGNTKLTFVSEDFLADRETKLDLRYTFSGCSNVRGRVPELWKNPVLDGNKCFEGCVNAANYDDIPAGWK